MKAGKFSVKSRSESFRFAFNGLSSLLKYEHNARIHFAAAIIAVAAGLFLGIDLHEWCLLFIVIGLVFLTELFNTSLEALCDAVYPELNENIRKAKDYAAGAVLISAVVSAVAGGFIFIPRLIELFKGTL
jgi:diacylglycerol kinase (ATP)